MRATLFRILLCVPAGLTLAADSGPASDPLAVAPGDYRLLFENEQVRVLEQKMAAKSKEARHYHPARVAIGLTDQLSRITLDGGAEFDRETKAGQATWRDAEFHQEANLSDKASHQVLVELKRGSGDMSQTAAWLQVPGARAAEAADPGQAAVALLGSRDQPGSFVERVRFADGFTEKPHRHNTEMHLVVLSGRYCLGYGERFERGAAQCHGAGAFLAVQPNLPHYSWSEGVSVVQIEAQGPMTTTYADGTGATKAAVPAPAPAPAPARAEVAVSPPMPPPAPVEPTAPAATVVATAPPPATVTPLPDAPPLPIKENAREPAPAPDKKAQAATPTAAPSPPPPPAYSGPRVHARDYDFAYEERGQGPVLVLVHGELSDSRAFAPVLNSLARKHRVISYSRRYHWPNEQSKSSMGYSYTEHADDLVTVLTALNLDRADVLGDGYGAGVVLLAAVRSPGRFQHLVLIDPDAPELISDAKISKALIERDQALGNEAKRLYKASDPRDALRLVVDAEFGPGMFDGAGQELRAIWQQNAGTIPMRVTDTPGIDCERAKAVTAPLLLLRGARTPDANRAVGHALERCLKQAQAIEIADAGHSIQRDQPGSFVAAIEIFLGAN